MIVLQYCVSLVSLTHLFGQQVLIVEHSDGWKYEGFEPKFDMFSRLVYVSSAGISAVLSTIWSVLTIKKGYEAIGSTNFRSAEKRILIYTTSNCLVSLLMFALQSFRLYGQIAVLTTGVVDQPAMLSWFYNNASEIFVVVHGAQLHKIVVGKYMVSYNYGLRPHPTDLQKYLQAFISVVDISH
ncbi:hypothetical protein Y032_0134g1811 [Ancylostoma ceylanicum]|uniref:Serpentine receptor class gamma n=1 Tax=Ancylostoma ceylanicum TaxID=53326 RepID=A0A016T5Y6_9BILA|nr:hypothetical protein Y032_0134g1811 [Ancylostoma ceylanicum]